VARARERKHRESSLRCLPVKFYNVHQEPATASMKKKVSGFSPQMSEERGGSLK